MNAAAALTGAVERYGRAIEARLATPAEPQPAWLAGSVVRP